MQFHDFVDRRQGTQVALERALGYLMDHDFVPPQRITIITDELEAARFLEQGKTKVNQTEHSIIGQLRTLKCKLLFRRPVKGDRIFGKVKRAAVKECSSQREISFRVFNKNFVHRSARKWSKEEFQKRYEKPSSEGGANLTMKGFFPRAKDFPPWITTDFVTTQFFTGHGKFREYLTTRAQAMNDPGCTCDGLTPQTPKHVLLECLNYSRVTRRHFSTAGQPMHCLISLTELPQTTELFIRAAHEIHHALKVDNETTMPQSSP